MVRPAPLIDQVCDTFELGHPVAAWRRVRGGLSNELRRLTTTAGRFAVKRMIAGTQHSAFRDNVEASFRIEQEAVRAGVAAPRPISPRGESGCLAQVECGDGSPCWVRVHEWVPGRPPDHRTVAPRIARQLGRLIAEVHGLGVPMEDDAAAVDVIDDEVWRAFEERAGRMEAPWAAQYSRLLPVVEGLQLRIERRTSRPPVPGHRDADDKNTLVARGGRLTLIDWDAAGPVDADHEVTSLFLDWSGTWTGDPRHGVVRAIAEGYSAHSERTISMDASGWIAAQMGWLRCNLQRALGDFGAEDVQAGEVELEFFQEQLPRIERSMDTWLKSWGPV